MSTLQVDGLSVRFGNVHAVTDVSISLRAGEVAGLIGPNGAGKTTFIDAISGFVASTGTIRLDDRPIDQLRAFARARAGLVRTWQSVELFDGLNVRDNVRVATEHLRSREIVRSILLPTRPTWSRRVDEVLERLGIGHLAEAMPNELSAGHRQRVGIARALVSDATVLLLDEPAAGADHSETGELGSLIREVAEQGAAVLLIEHDMDLVLSVTSTLHVLDTGVLLESGPTSEVRHSPAVIAAYLGTPIDAEPTTTEEEVSTS
jgi:branched-chain amino acid transport system ATP-binding protein